MWKCSPDQRILLDGCPGQTKYGTQWQVAVFGGRVMMREDPDSDLGVRQGGIAWLMDKRQTEYLIPELDIQTMLKGGKIMSVSNPQRQPLLT
jgi:hypothetical protein